MDSQTDNDKNEEAEDKELVCSAVQNMVDRLFSEKKHKNHLLVHSTNANLNRSRYNIPQKLLQKSDWRVTLPSPLYTSSIGLMETDPCHKRTIDYRRYITSLSRLPGTYKKYHANRLYRKSQKRDIYNINVINLAELMELQPDEYFTGRYDWFYTGGNLDVIESDNKRYVIHAGGKNLQNLYVSKAETDITYTKLVNIFRKRSQVITHGNENPEVLEVQCFNSNNISARRRNYISLYTFDDGVLQYRYHLYNDAAPFISSTRVSDSSGNIVTSDLSKTVAIWDLNKSAEKPQQLLFSAPDPNKNRNWNCVRYLDENLYAFVDVKKLYMLDRRQSKVENSRAYHIHTNSEVCEDNTILSCSYFKDLIYIGSTHKLQAVDLRFMGMTEEGREHVLLDWTHQMNRSPLMLRTSLVDNTEMIVMCSSENGDVRVCQNNKISLKNIQNENTEVVYSSADIPLKPPDSTESYQRARLNGLCLNPYVPMKERLMASQSGLCLLDTDENSSILIGKSNGDIFGQMVVDDHEEAIINEDNLAAMKLWQDRLLEIHDRSQNTLNITSVENLSSLKRIFRCKQLNIDETVPNDDDGDVDYKIPKTALRRGKWQQSIPTLQKYKDALAANILSIWDFDDMECDTKGEKLVLPSQVFGLNDTNVVDQWLQQSEIGEVDERVLNASGISLENIFKDPPAESKEVDSSTRKSVKKLSKRKYVKGF